MTDSDVPGSLLEDAAWLFTICDQDEHLSVRYGIDLEVQVSDALLAFAKGEPLVDVVAHIDRRHPSADSATLALVDLARKHGRDTALPRPARVEVPPEIAFCAFALPLIDLLDDLGPCDLMIAALGAAAHLLAGGTTAEALHMLPADDLHLETVRQALIGLPPADAFVAFVARSQFVMRRYLELRPVSRELDDVTPLGRLFNDAFWLGHERMPVWHYLPNTEVWLCFW